MEENLKNEASNAAIGAGKAPGTEQRENKTKQNKLLPFSIEAILSAPHPKRPKRDSVRLQLRRAPRENVTQEEKSNALSTLEEFTSITLNDAKRENRGKRKKTSITLEQKLNAIQARLNQRKRRKPRTCFTNRQIIELERRFVYQKYLSPTDRDDLSMALGISGAQIITWFQNRRAKMRRDVEELKADVKASSIMDPEDVNKMCEDYEI